jgi:hypothetical protein
MPKQECFGYSAPGPKEKTPKTIRVDEDGALARNFEFTKLLLQQNLTMDTT